MAGVQGFKTFAVLALLLVFLGSVAEKCEVTC